MEEEDLEEKIRELTVLSQRCLNQFQTEDVDYEKIESELRRLDTIVPQAMSMTVSHIEHEESFCCGAWPDIRLERRGKDFAKVTFCPDCGSTIVEEDIK
jgi:hypothetical protein